MDKIFRFEYVDPESGKEKVLEIAADDLKKFEEAAESFKGGSTTSELHGMIDSLPVSADVKVILAKIGDFVLKVSGTMVAIGKKVVEMIVFFVKKFPNTSISLVIGLVIGVLISSIPLIGVVFGGIAKVIFSLLGLAFGFWEDIKDKALKSSVEAAKSEVFSSLKDVQVTASV